MQVLWFIFLPNELVDVLLMQIPTPLPLPFPMNKAVGC